MPIGEDISSQSKWKQTSQPSQRPAGRQNNELQEGVASSRHNSAAARTEHWGRYVGASNENHPLLTPNPSLGVSIDL